MTAGPKCINNLIDLFKNVMRKICDKAVRNYYFSMCLVPDQYRTQERYTRVVEKEPWQLYYVPNHLKTREMSNKGVCRDSYSLQFILDNLKTQEMCKKVVKKIP